MAPLTAPYLVVVNGRPEQAFREKSEAEDLVRQLKAQHSSNTAIKVIDMSKI
jgi:hypothetical protein